MFYAFLKNHDFWEIWKSSEVLAKMVECILFYPNVVCKTQRNTISPFCEEKYCTTAVHFRFQCESLKHQFDGILYFFRISKRPQLGLVVRSNRLQFQCLVPDNTAYGAVRILYEIACKILNFYDNAANSGCLHIIPQKK